MFQLAATCVVGLLLACAPAIVAPFETRDNNAAYSSNRGMSVYIGPAPCDVLLDAARTWLAAHHPPVGDSSTDSPPEVGECRAADPGTGHVGEANGDAIPVPGDAATHTIIEKAGQGIAATQPGSPADAATTRGGPKVRVGATTNRPKTQHDTHHGYTSAGRRDGVVRDGRHHSSPAIANTVGSEPSHGVDNHTAQEPGAVRDRNVVVDDEGGMSEAAILSPAPPPVAIRRAHSGMPEVSTNVRKSPHNVRPPATDVHLSHNASRREEPRNDASWDSRRIVDARDDFDGTSVSNMVEQDANTRDTASNEHDVRAIAAPSPTATSKASSSDLFLSQRFPQRSAGSRAVPEERGRSDTPETAASFQQATTAGSRQTPTSTQASEPSALQETRATTSLRRALQSAQVGAVTTLAGQSQSGFKDATGASAQFYNPFGVAIDPTGKYALVADATNHRIRKVCTSTCAGKTCKCERGTPVKNETLCKDGPSLCAACDPGHTLNASNTGCVACAVGRFLLRGSNECKDCAAGSVAPSAGSANCSVCASGKHVVNTTAPCANCPAGRFVAKSGQLNCSACPRGKGPTSARTACQDCQGIQFSTCGICKDCKAPNIRIDAILCVAPNTACQPGSAPLNDSESGGASARNNSCGTVERCKQCPPGKVSADGGTCLACSEGNRVANQEQVACEGCGPGTAPSPDRSRCVGCIGTNFSSFGVQCNPCDRRFILDRNRTSCTACAAGKGPTTDQTSCVACRPGKFSSAGVCETCVPGPAGQTIAAFAGSVVCLNCPAGKVAHNNATECRCAAGTYNISAMVARCFSAEYFPREVTVIRPEDRSECQPCPACLDCNSIGSPVTKSGYRLRKSNDHVTVHVEVGLNVTALIKPRQLSEHHAFTCPHASSCLSGPVRGNETLDCLIGHTGVLCQGCESGWSKTPSGSCFECQGGNDGQWALLAVLVVVVLVAMYFGLSVYMKRKRQKQEQQGGSAGLLFDCLDTDRSGNITRAELRTGLAELGMTLSESETFALMETIDMDGSGDVDRDEFGSCPD